MEAGPIALCAASYLLGGIPSGYLIARYLKGIDIREYGSGNPGAANVYRMVGRWAGWATLAIDALKGFIPVFVATRYYPSNHAILIICGALAIFGHIWTVFLRFRGGKGVATSCGVFAALLPFPTLCSFLAFIVAVAITNHISVGSIAASIILPVASFWMNAPKPLFFMALAVSALILLKHISNIRRLLGRQELDFQDIPGTSVLRRGNSRYTPEDRSRASEKKRA